MHCTKAIPCRRRCLLAVEFPDVIQVAKECLLLGPQSPRGHGLKDQREVVQHGEVQSSYILLLRLEQLADGEPVNVSQGIYRR